MFRQILRAARFDPKLYEEVANDPAAIIQAAAIVLLSTLAFGLGMRNGLYFNKPYLTILGWSLLYHVVSWAALGLLMYVIRLRRTKEPISLVATFNGIGFAYLPGTLYVFMSLGGEFIPLLVNALALVGMTVGLTMAFRKTTDIAGGLAFLLAVAAVVMLVDMRQQLLEWLVL